MFLLETDSHFTGGERGRPHLLRVEHRRRHNGRSVCRTAPRDDHRIGGREVVGGGRTVLPCFLGGVSLSLTAPETFFRKLSEWMQHWPKKKAFFIIRVCSRHTDWPCFSLSSRSKWKCIGQSEVNPSLASHSHHWHHGCATTASATVDLIVRRVEGGGSSAVCRHRRRRVLGVDALGAVGGENVVGPEGADVVQGPLDERVPPCKISSVHLVRSSSFSPHYDRTGAAISTRPLNT